MTSSVIYQGGLRTECLHVKSGQKIITDAPTDNNGKGEAFSPTDLVATALASCMITVMGIKARNMEIDLVGTKAEVIKTMASDPRRISRIEISIVFNTNDWDEKTCQILKKTALNCPVSKSIDPNIEQLVEFIF